MNDRANPTVENKTPAIPPRFIPGSTVCAVLQLCLYPSGRRSRPARTINRDSTKRCAPHYLLLRCHVPPPEVYNTSAADADLQPRLLLTRCSGCLRHARLCSRGSTMDRRQPCAVAAWCRGNVRSLSQKEKIETTVAVLNIFRVETSSRR